MSADAPIIRRRQRSTRQWPAHQDRIDDEVAQHQPQGEAAQRRVGAQLARIQMLEVDRRRGRDKAIEAAHQQSADQRQQQAL